MTAADFSFEVEYGAGDNLTIRIDNGKDGNADRAVVATVGQLGSMSRTK